MDLDKLHKKLVEAARQQPPSDHVPYAFEKRIMARLKSLPAPDPLGEWVAGLWRAAAPCVAVLLMLSVWTYTAGPTPPTSTATTESVTLSTALEQSLMAPWELASAQ